MITRQSRKYKGANMGLIRDIEWQIKYKHELDHNDPYVLHVGEETFDTEYLEYGRIIRAIYFPEIWFRYSIYKYPLCLSNRLYKVRLEESGKCVWRRQHHLVRESALDKVNDQNRHFTPYRILSDIFVLDEFLDITDTLRMNISSGNKYSRRHLLPHLVIYIIKYNGSNVEIYKKTAILLEENKYYHYARLDDELDENEFNKFKDWLTEDKWKAAVEAWGANVTSMPDYDYTSIK